MNGIGEKLRRAREARGYSQSQIADMTRILVQIVQGLEEENYSRIVAPIYGRGFVKLYAEAVGLDPAECVREFMEAYTGASAAKKAEGPKPREPEPEEKSAAEPSAQGEEAPQEDITAPQEAKAQEEAADGEEPAEPAPRRRISRYAPPMPEEPRPWLRTPPPFVWRIAFVAICAAIVVWAAVAGLKALYRATCTPSCEAESEAVETAKTPSTAAPAPAAMGKARKPAESLPDMYAD